MAKYEVTHEDGRTTTVNSDSSDESAIKKQANHHDLTRVLHRQRVGYTPRRENWDSRADPSMAVSVRRLDD